MRRRYQEVPARGEVFRFYFEQGDDLHITVQHGTTPEDAIRTFFEGDRSEWDQVHLRYESRTETHCIYWTRHAHDGSVIVISCWPRGAL